ncbi:hypothetical protein VYU27_005858 [Nannochloropsis oceanica]
MDTSLPEEGPATETGELLHARRRQSLRMMVAMSLNQSCKDAIQDILLPSSDYLDNRSDPNNKFRELLIKAKESGLTWDDTFSHFTSAPETTAAISQKDFAAGLQKLSSNTSCDVTQADIEQLTKSLMIEETKQVSLDGIKAFALAIPHVSWKVERIRRLSSALSTEEGTSTGNCIPEQAPKTQIKKKTSTTKPSPPAVASKMTSARSLSRRESSTSTGKVAFSSSVPAMRRSRSRMSSSASIPDSVLAGACRPLPRKSSSKTTPESVLQKNSGKTIPEPVPLYSKVASTTAPNPLLVDIPLNRKAIEALADTRSAVLGNEEDPAGMTPLQQAERDYLAQYLTQRLVLEEKQQGINAGLRSKRINILPQTGDTWNSLLTERPKLLKPPAPVHGARLMSLEDFHKASAEITKLTTQARSHSTAAKVYATKTTTELDGLSAMEKGKRVGNDYKDI